MAVLLRIFSLLGLALVEAARLVGAWLGNLFSGRGRSFREIFAKFVPGICERLGGSFPKIGQILSTRADLFSDEVCRNLSRLQDRVKPLSRAEVESILARLPFASSLRQIDPEPIASATIAQVHRAIRVDNGAEVALKIRRPGIERSLQNDCALANALGRFLDKLPFMRSFPIRTALADVGALLAGQTDFSREAGNFKKLRSIFAQSPEVLVPGIHDDLCAPEVLCMDYVPGLCKVTDPRISDEKAHAVLTAAVHALYKMIFQAGVVHCDMHPGNVLMASDQRLVILDAGFVAELDTDTRRAFAQFFLAIAFRDGNAAARIVRETAERLPPNLDVKAFDRDIAALIDRVGGLRASEFQVAGFVRELFAIQRQHGICGASRFTLTILSLLVLEGAAKERFPELDFQKEAVPFVVSALAEVAA